MRNLGILLKTNLKTVFGISKLKHEKPIKLIGYFLLAAYVVYSLFVTFGFYSELTADTLEKYNLFGFMLVLFFLMACLMIFNFTIYDSKSNMFNSSDNDMLLSMPIKTSTILTSRTLRIIIWNLLTSAFIILPALYVYTTRIDVSFSFYPKALAVFLLLPIIPTILASLIGYFIAYITSKVNHKNWIELFLSVFIVVLIYLALGNAEKLLNLFISNQDTMIKVIKYAFYPIYLVYEIFDGNNLSLLFYILINIVALLVFIIPLSKSYKKILMKLQENKSKSNYVMKSLKTNSLRKTLFKKELKRYFSSPIYVLNTFFGVAMILILAVATIFYDQKALLTALNVSVADSGIFELLMVFIVFVSFMSSTTSASISLEGKNFWIIKSLPIKPISSIDSKILLNLFIILPITFVSLIIFKVTIGLSIVQFLVLFITSIGAALASTHFGMLVNLKFPKMDAISDVVIVKRSLSTMIAVIAPMIVIFAVAGAYSELTKTISSNILLTIIILLLFIIFVIERKILTTWGVNKFKNID